MFIISNPFSLRPTAMVDLPSPGIPARQTINLGNFNKIK